MLNKIDRFIYFAGTIFGSLWLGYDYTKNDINQVLIDIAFLGFWFYQLVIKK